MPVDEETRAAELDEMTLEQAGRGGTASPDGMASADAMAYPDETAFPDGMATTSGTASPDGTACTGGRASAAGLWVEIVRRESIDVRLEHRSLLLQRPEIADAGSVSLQNESALVNHFFWKNL